MESVEQLAEEGPGPLVAGVADVRIVDGTGIEAVTAIKAELGQIPVILVTGDIDVLSEQASPAIVEEPIGSRVLAEVCERVCNRAA